MRPKIPAELAAVKEQYETRGISFCRIDVKRLISPYPPREKVDRTLANLGEDFSHDGVHDIPDEDDDAAVAEEDNEHPSCSSDDDDGRDYDENTSGGVVERNDMEIAPPQCRAICVSSTSPDDDSSADSLARGHKRIRLCQGCASPRVGVDKRKEETAGVFAGDDLSRGFLLASARGGRAGVSRAPARSCGAEAKETRSTRSNSRSRRRSRGRKTN